MVKRLTDALVTELKRQIELQLWMRFKTIDTTTLIAFNLHRLNIWWDWGVDCRVKMEIMFRDRMEKKIYIV